MGGCCFRKIIFFLLIFLCSSSWGRCPMADEYRRRGKKEEEVIALSTCAMHYNDDISQVKLAEMFLNGTPEVEKDEMMALYLYQLAAESGHAEAQVRLAEMLQDFDSSSERRSQLKDYMGKLQLTGVDTSSFKGEIQHPYTLLLLASERVENKWYYPSSNRGAPARASTLLKNYKITPEKQQAALREASRWKTRKLLEMAKEILSSEEYPDFEEKLQNSVTRTQAVTELKERLMGYIEKRQKER